MLKLKEKASRPWSHHAGHKYLYEELKHPDNIRILKLRRTKAQLECTIHQIKYSDGGFQALSYVWGSPEMPHKMVVRNMIGINLGYIPLTASLKDALHDLRDSSQLKSKTFWIDQICIDQTGKEKNHQVALMGKIYENAERVILYCGPAPVNKLEEERGMALLRLLNEHYAKNRPLIAVCKRQDWYRSEDWTWLLQMVYGQWTERLWIVQELLLNPELFILCGSQLLPWDDLALISFLHRLDSTEAVGDVIDRFWQENFPNTLRDPEHVGNYYFSIWRSRQLRRRSRSPSYRSLLENIAYYPDLDCCDPRDRIYAMLGISYDSKALQIEPNYDEAYTIDQLYQDVSVSILTATSNLYMLCFSCRSGQQWDSFEEPQRDEGQTSLLDECSWALGIPYNPYPNALGLGFKAHPEQTLKSTVVFHSSDSVLSLKGCIVDGISMAATTTWALKIDDRQNIASIMQKFCQDVLSWITMLEELGTTVQIVKSLCRVLVADPSWEPLASKASTGVDPYAYTLFLFCRYVAWYGREDHVLAVLDERMKGCLEQCDKLILDLAPLLLDESTLQSFSLGAELTSDQYAYAKDIHSHSGVHGRSLGTTNSGRMYNAMNQPRKGDVIAALQGSHCLWVLRPVGKRYRLIGDAWVDGLMDGEFYEGLDYNEVDYDIELI
ncbi:HET-domain-containing protein [Microthyrium microscopicum]|uniref:HET-domain-containing protein n=1 Tax=Microthyrium microscopicum TaxID=703497 RepID=A0A6A6UKK8_9PEZI|nr:HET-domain-containing protein [Microthyrium microscopicum]